jgi:diguanylate cyclase (GGDEF)-like protein
MMHDSKDDTTMDGRKKLTLEEELSFLQKIIDQQNNIIIVANSNEVVMVNHQFLDFFVQPSLDSFKREFGDISNAFVRHERYFHLGKVAPGEYWIDVLKSKKDTESIISMVDLGEYEPKAFAVKVSKLEDDGETLYVLTFTDITNFAIQANQYFYQATHDKLTGIYNRSHFLELFEEMKEESNRFPLAGMIIRLDNFKTFNETHGQQKGDELLKDIVDLVNMHLRENDVFARLGAKEFAMLLPVMEKERAQAVANTLKDEISTMETYTDMKATVSISLKIIEGPESQTMFLSDLESLLAQAKEAGDNQVVVA